MPYLLHFFRVCPQPPPHGFYKARRRFCAWWSCTSPWARPGDHHITIIYTYIYIYNTYIWWYDILMTMVIWCDMMTGSSPSWCIYICMYVHIYILMTMVKWWQYNIININYCIFQRSLEVKLPTIRTYGKAEVGRVREEKRRREKIREIQRRESTRRKNMQVREKVEKSWNTMFFQWFVAPEGRKVGSLKGAEPSNQMRDENIARRAAWSTFGNQIVESISRSDHFWKLRCRKSARRCSAKHISKSKCQKHHMFGKLLDLQMSFCMEGARDCAPCQKCAPCQGFCSR